jgi:hypothetical protein
VVSEATLWCRKRLKDVISHMRERIYGRIGNKSDNAFKLRKFAKMYDLDQTGYVSHPEGLGGTLLFQNLALLYFF